MVEVGDIVEITDPKWKQKKISMLGRRYVVKDIPNRRGNFPALKATPLNYEYTDKKGKFFPSSPLYTPQSDGSTWESSGFTHKGRTRTIPKNLYIVIQSSGQSFPIPASITPSESSDSSSATPSFGGSGVTPSSIPEATPDEVLTPDIPVKKSLTVEEQMALAAKLFMTITKRSNSHFEPYVNDRELEYLKFSNYRIRLNEDNAKGMSVRVIFSASIDVVNPAETYEDEKGFWKAAQNPTKGIVRQYTIGEKVQDIINGSGEKPSSLQWFRDESKWNEGGKVLGIVIDFAPADSDNIDSLGVIEQMDASADSDESKESHGTEEDDLVLSGLGLFLEQNDSDSLSTYPQITVNLVADDGEEFTLTHTYQGDISFAFPEVEVEVIEKVSSAPVFGGIPALSTKSGKSPEESSVKIKKWEDIILIPNFDTQMNRFPSTQKNSADSDFDIRAVIGIDFNHDHPVLRPYEKPYEVDWDIQPSIMASSATGYIEAIFTVNNPNLPEGSVTDKLPGYHGEITNSYNPEWMKFPRQVSVILPGDSEFMRIPADGGEETIIRCDEIKFYDHKGKFRDVQLIQSGTESKWNDLSKKMEEQPTLLTATWKVGETIEFKTKAIGSSLNREKYQTFKGELTRLIVEKNQSREPAINSAQEARRERRIEATMEKNTADIFFGGDERPTHQNTFVVVLKNDKNTPYSGQIIRVKLRGEK